jgi:2-polyprenyl-3-methyl-5-hydroxy-6-metoxy-1,4-benzoquinol methylase
LFARPFVIPEITQRQMDTVEDAELFTPIYKKLHKTFVLKKEINEVRRICGRGTLSLLDVGCGTGWTTNYWQTHDFKVTGIEPSEVRGNLANQRYGFRVIPKYIEHAELDEKYDVAILRHVIEHFEHPFDVVNQVSESLHSKGLIIIVVPNIDCIGRYIFGTSWPWVIEWHCSFFNPLSIKYILNRAGFEVRKMYQTPSPLYYPQGFAGKFPSSFISKCLQKPGIFPLTFSLPFMMAGLLAGRSDNITVIAQKN